MHSLERTFVQNYLMTEGRIGRCDYWLRGAVLALITVFIGGATWLVWELYLCIPATPVIVMFCFFLLWLLIAGYSSFCISSQRAHDVGRSAVFGFAAEGGGFLGFYLAFGSGDEGINAYGEPPRDPSQIKIYLTLAIALGSFLIAIALFVIRAWHVLKH